jgi:hypothetical protein
MEAELCYHGRKSRPPYCDNGCPPALNDRRVVAIGADLGRSYRQQKNKPKQQAFVSHRFLPNSSVGHSTAQMAIVVPSNLVIVNPEKSSPA